MQWRNIGSGAAFAGKNASASPLIGKTHQLPQGIFRLLCVALKQKELSQQLGDVLGAIMALYSRQTQLPINLLRLNGFYTELVRRFHPLEWASALGWTPILRLPLNLEDSWHQLGNTLSPHHFMLFARHLLLSRRTLQRVKAPGRRRFTGRFSLSKCCRKFRFESHDKYDKGQQMEQSIQELLKRECQK